MLGDGNVLRQVVLYRKPKDMPDHYVVRQWKISAGQLTPLQPAFGFKEESKARAFIAQEWPHLVPLGRDNDDDPVIVGVWT